MIAEVLLAVALAAPAQSLTGLHGCSVVAIDRDSNDVVPPGGFAASVIDALKRLGVDVVKYEPWEPSLVILIGVNRIDLEFRQVVKPISLPSRRFVAATWWAGAPVSAHDLAAERVPGPLIDEFVSAWREANASAGREK